MIPHDRQICEQALNVHDLKKLWDLEDLCITDEGKKFIHKILVAEHHKEEAEAGIL